MYFVNLLFGPVIKMIKRIPNQAYRIRKKQAATTSQQDQEVSSDQWLSLSLKAVAYKLINTVLLIPLLIVVLHPLLVVYCSILLSLTRLREQNYGQGDGDASKTNLKSAMMIFYSLALSQGVLYLLWFILNAGNMVLARLVSGRCKFEPDWGRKSVSRYLTDTKFKCIKDLSATRGRNLITYAAGLLDSDYEEDYISGARMLVSFIEKQKAPVRVLIRSSRNKIRKLLMMLAWKDPDDREVRMLAAKIVAHVASDISLPQFPGTLECISSLLEPSENIPTIFREARQPKRMKNEGHQHEQDCRLEYQLIQQGLLILERLAHDKHNCIEIYGAEGVLTHITAWMLSETLISGNEQVGWVNVLKGSFNVVARLIGFLGNTATQLSHIIVSELEATTILSHRSCPEIQLQAIEIFTLSCYFERSIGPNDVHITNFLGLILRLFLSCKEVEHGGASSLSKPQVKVKAGEAVAILSMTSKSYSESILCQHKDLLVDLDEILHSQNIMVYRIIAAEILHHLCAHCCIDHCENLLRKVLELLRMNIERDTQGYNNVQKNGDVQGYDLENQVHTDNAWKHLHPQHDDKYDDKRLQSTLLCIIAAIHVNKLTGAHDFARVVCSGAFPSCFVGLLKKMVESNSRMATPDGLQIVKAAAALVNSMISNSRDKFIQQIREQRIIDSLSKASKIMSNLDNLMAFLGTRQNWLNNFLLSDLVKDAEKLLNIPEDSTA